jgi:chromosome segregation ATPase
VGFLDKLKEGAGQAKELAQQAAERAKEEAKELQLKRQLSNEYEALGREVFSLVESGEVTHAKLTPGVQRISDLAAELAALEADARQAEEQAGAAAPPPPPA